MTGGGGGTPSGVRCAPEGPTGVRCAPEGPTGVRCAPEGPTGVRCAPEGPTGVRCAPEGPTGVRCAPEGPTGVRCAPECSDRSKTRPLIGLKLGHSRAWPTLVSAGAGRGWEEGDARSAGHLRAAAQGLRRGQEPAPGGARDGARARHGAALPRDAAAGATEAQAAAAGAGAGAAAAGAVGPGVVGAHHGEAAHHGPEAAAGAARGGLRGRADARARVSARVAPHARRGLRAAGPPPGRERAGRLLRGQRRALRRAAQGLALPDAADALGARLRPAL